MTSDLRPLHRSALHAADELICRVTQSDFGRSTPCESWNLADLLAHMIGQHLGFAAAVRDGDAPGSAYAPIPFTPERWQRSMAVLLAAFDGADLDAEAVEIELAPIPLPMTMIISAQLLDTVVHTWDVAQALGIRYVPAVDLLETVARLAATIPDDDRRAAPDAAFAHRLPTTDGTPWAHALAQLGRKPLAAAGGLAGG